jgi:PmbA protein
MNEDLLSLAQSVVKRALRAGSNEAAAVAYRARQVDVTWRDGELEKITDATTRGVGLRLYVDHRYSAVSTSDLRPEALYRFVADSIALARSLDKDPFRSLPDPELYKGQAQLDLQVEDPRYPELTADARRSAARAAETAAREVKGKDAIISVTTYVSDSRAEEYRVHSNGFTGSKSDTAFSVSAEVSVRDPDGRKPEEGWYAATRFQGELPGAAEIGRRAAERALARISSKKSDSAVLPMVVDNRAAGRLVSFLISPLSAQALQQKRSCLEGRVGATVGSSLLDLTDDPLLLRGLGSRLFDSEGFAARRFPVFEAGVLRNYYVDDYYGKKLSTKPTTRSPSNLAWKLGAKNQPALVAQVKDGIFVNGFLGGNSNSVTGDFSLGVQGFRIRGGQLAEPVGEMNVAGNHLAFWKRLVAVGNDPWTYSSMRTPTLVFDGVQFAGT